MSSSSSSESHPFAGPFAFGHINLDPSQVFYVSSTGLSYGSVNLKPIVPGHVLVISRRVVSRVALLTPQEIADLWHSAQLVSKMIEHEMRCDGFTFAIQDGAAAGQSVFHVHIHILPRRFGDFQRNDEIYDHLEEHLRHSGTRPESDSGSKKLDLDENRRARTAQEMATEAATYRSFMIPFLLP